MNNENDNVRGNQTAEFNSQQGVNALSMPKKAGIKTYIQSVLDAASNTVDCTTMGATPRLLFGNWLPPYMPQS